MAKVLFQSRVEIVLHEIEVSQNDREGIPFYASANKSHKPQGEITILAASSN